MKYLKMAVLMLTCANVVFADFNVVIDEATEFDIHTKNLYASDSDTVGSDTVSCDDDKMRATKRIKLDDVESTGLLGTPFQDLIGTPCSSAVSSLSESIVENFFFNPNSKRKHRSIKRNHIMDALKAEPMDRRSASGRRIKVTPKMRDYQIGIIVATNKAQKVSQGLSRWQIVPCESESDFYNSLVLSSSSIIMLGDLSYSKDLNNLDFDFIDHLMSSSLGD